MTLTAVDQPPSELDQFIDFLYDGSEGYVYLAAKVPNDDKDWKQEFFHYPTEAAKLTKAVRGAQSSHDIYIAPALFQPIGNETVPGKADKEHFKSSNVVWIDFDGNSPADWSDFSGPPSYILQSSIEGHQHVYWRLNNPLTTVAEVEKITRSLAYNFQADNSGWDAVQVLRPPETYNHKRSSQVKVVSSINVRYDSDLFESLPPIPEGPSGEWTVSELPEAQDVILKYAFPPDAIQLLKKERHEIVDRSKSLQHLAYACCEAGMSDNEVFVILRLADENWEKFKYRRDRNKRLADIILYARHKYPLLDTMVAHDGDTVFTWSYLDFLSAEIELDWVLEGMLMEGGNMLMAGKSGIGKTLFALDAMRHIAMGKDFLHYKVPAPKKIGFLSLEMGHPDLQIFMRKQDETLDDTERALLNENLTIIPHGESWGLNVPVGQARLAQLIEHHKWEGLFVDSVGSAILGDISSSAIVQSFTNFNDSIRKEYGLFLWYIHHTRKANTNGPQRDDQDSIFGDQYLVARATSAYMLLSGRSGTIKMRNVKNRLAPQEPDYYLERSPSLSYSRIEAPSPIIVSTQDQPTEQPKSENGKFDL